MNYAPSLPINTARHIARSAQQQIKDTTGYEVTLLMCSPETSFKTPERMLGVIAKALDMSPACFKMRSRMREITELRFIGAIFLRKYFPQITLNQIAAFYGGQDHTSVLNGLARANDLLYTGDVRFIKKYNRVLNMVNIWLRKEA